MKKNMKKIKNIWIWIIIWAWLTLSLWAYAATNWTLWELFKLISWSENGTVVSNVYRLEWSNIEDETVTSYEIDDDTITEDDINDSFIARDSNMLDGMDSEDFLQSNHDDLMNWELSVTWDIYTKWKKVATEVYVDSKISSSISITWVITKYWPYWYTDSSAKNLGSHVYCSINKMWNAEDSHYCNVYKSWSTWYMKQYKTWCIASCLD